MADKEPLTQKDIYMEIRKKLENTLPSSINKVEDTFTVDIGYYKRVEISRQFDDLKNYTYSFEVYFYGKGGKKEIECEARDISNPLRLGELYALLEEKLWERL